MNDFKYVLKLEKIKIPGVSIKRIPDLEQIIDKSAGKLLVVKYFVNNGSGPFMIRFTSKDKFQTLYSLDFCDDKLNPKFGFVLKEDANPEAFLEKLKVVLKDTKKRKKIFKESNTVSDKLLKTLMFEDTKDDITRISMVGGAIFAVALPLFMLITTFTTMIKNHYIEKKSAGRVEEDLNRELFSNQTGKESVFSHYNKLISYVDSVIKNDLRSLIITGPPGTSKSYIVRRTLHFSGLKPRKDYIIMKGGSMGPIDLYSVIFKNRNRLVILDDFDSPLKDQDTINLLKSITDSYSRRVVSVPMVKKLSTSSVQVMEVPERFEFTGSVIIITNYDRKDIDRALLSRAPAIEVRYNSKQIEKMIVDMMEFVNPKIPMEMKKEVYEYMIQLHKKDPKIEFNFRSFKTATEARYGVPQDWKELVKVIVNFRG